jgi:hypothetical protein
VGGGFFGVVVVRTHDKGAARYPHHVFGGGATGGFRHRFKE